MSAPEVTLPVPRTATTGEVLAAAAEALARAVPAVMATVLSRRGSAPATPGQKLIACADGVCLGTVGGGALERSVLEEITALLAVLSGTAPALADRREDPGAPRTISLNLGAGLGMCCGGGVEILLEPLVPAAPVLLVGAGHVATALAPLLAGAGFAVTVCDEREEWAEPARVPSARVVAGSYRAAGTGLLRRAAVLVMTHDHALDQEVLEWALREGFAFVGGVGSRAKHARTCARLTARGFSDAEIARVRMPLGVSIGARSPFEIAVAIAAEMVAWRRGVALATTEHGARAEAAGRASTPASGRKTEAS